jgi:hypothetical protein
MLAAECLLDESVAAGAEFPSCAVCRSNPEAREAWGCDAEIEVPIMEIGCVVCDGKDEACSHCEGYGRVPITRCPWSLVKASDLQAVELSIMFLENGVLPGPGSVLDQSAVFSDCWRIVAKVRAEQQAKAMENN